MNNTETIKAGDIVDILTKPCIDSEKLKMTEGAKILGSNSLYFIIARPNGSGGFSGKFYFAKDTILAMELAA